MNGPAPKANIVGIEADADLRSVILITQDFSIYFPESPGAAEESLSFCFSTHDPSTRFF